MSRSVVVLPQPLGPSRVTSDPAATSKSTWSTAGAVPKAFASPTTRMSFTRSPSSGRSE